MLHSYHLTLSHKKSRVEPLLAVAKLLQHTQLQVLLVDIIVPSRSPGPSKTHELAAQSAQLQTFLSAIGTALHTVTCIHGMRATMTRSVSFDCLVGSEEVFGKSDDYHGQPQFSGGSWRFLAAQLGAGEALVEMMRVELIKRDRTEDSHQRSRMARCVTALETSRKWVRDTAEVMVDPGMTSERVIQHANGARIVVERSLLDIIEMVQRSVGLQLYSRQHPCERIIRDLSTYLRQPAPDALLEKLGEHGFAMAQQGLAGGLYDEES
ncbi:MAG: hypothetical protein WDW38_008976 [Sanguina aurantia]